MDISFYTVSSTSCLVQTLHLNLVSLKILSGGLQAVSFLFYFLYCMCTLSSVKHLKKLAPKQRYITISEDVCGSLLGCLCSLHSEQEGSGSCVTHGAWKRFTLTNKKKPTGPGIIQVCVPLPVHHNSLLP